MTWLPMSSGHQQPWYQLLTKDKQACLPGVMMSAKPSKCWEIIGSARYFMFLAATKQLYKWYFPSVRLSVCPSVCHTLFTMFPSSYHHEIFKSYYHGQKWCPCKRSRSKVKVMVTEVNTQLSRFRTLTPVWIHIWQWNDAYSLMMLRRGALLFLKVIRQISRSHGSKKRRIWPRLGVSGL